MPTQTTLPPARGQGRHRALLPAVLLLVAAAVWSAAAAPLAAQGTGAPLSPVGAWLGVFPVAPPGEAPGRVLVTINADGTLLVSSSPTFLLTSPDGPAARLHNTLGHGSWAVAGERQFAATFVFLFFDETGAYFALQEIRSLLTLAADSDSATSLDSGRLVLADGTVADSFQDEPGPRFTRIRP